MKYLFLVLIVAIISCYSSGESDSKPPKIYFRPHFEALSTNRYPFYENGLHWNEARNYVKEKMHLYGARNLIEQVFNTTVEDHEIQGVNLIGLVEGDADKNGSVIVIGADYDSGIIGNQLKNNAGGVAILLELMHLFFDKIYFNQYHLNFTVIFVAFDLNTREYQESGMGKPGSFYFIHEWLLPYLGEANTSDSKAFRGAFILDSVTTYNIGEDTQTLRQGFDEAFPQAYNDIVMSNNKGDFLGFVYNTRQQNNILKTTFVDEYNNYIDKKARPYRLQEMEFKLGSSLFDREILEMLNHQAQFNFWTNIDNRLLPAFLLFDTDGDREDPTPDACSQISCNVDEFLTNERIDFMNKTTYALFATLMKLQTTHYDWPVDPDSATYMAQSTFLILFATFLSVAFGRLLQS